ncbi:ECF RNA polymerase sigma factor SigX [bioreactor metagenome]|uniref:ECF RNA polymerase sigma factor SigX n=1 Tax=bioreactor metagenome TaxID=1076179 RepID=A0A645ATZ9_9ZZZZ
MVVLAQTEKISWTALFNNDIKIFTELYNCYFPRVYNYVHYRVSNFQDANDLTSQIFEKLFSKFKYYQSERAPFAAWLFSIARNTITDYYRLQTRTCCTSLELTQDLQNTGPGPDELVILTEMQNHLHTALSSLTQRERDLISLKFWSGLSNRDIATLTGISESNTGVILFRAMKKLRKIFESQGISSYD